MDLPYHVEKDCESPWQFDLAYTPVAKVLEPALELLAISRLPQSEADEALVAMARRLEDTHTLDPNRFVAREGILFDAPAAQISPLVLEPGRLVVTRERVYFQPVHDVGGDCAVRSHPLHAVGAVIRRRHTLRPLGLEIFFSADSGNCGGGESSGGESGNGGGAHDSRHGKEEEDEMEDKGGMFFGPSVLLTLRSEAQREACVGAMLGALAAVAERRTAVGGAAVNTAGGHTAGSHAADRGSPPSLHRMHDALAGSALLEGRADWLDATTKAWRRGAVSNLDYLLYLNLAAGRGFNDLAQWPVMPWVLRDYCSPVLDLRDPGVYRDLSRPVGALNAERLKLLRERMKQMKESGMPPFLYGTHYRQP